MSTQGQNILQFTGNMPQQMPRQGYGQPSQSQVPLQSEANVITPGSNAQGQPPVYTTGGITDVVPSKSGDGGVEVFRKGNVVMVAHKTYETETEEILDFSKVIIGLEAINGHVVKIITADIDKKISDALQKVKLIDDYTPSKKRVELYIDVIN